MAQAAETAQSCPAPLSITPKARKRLTPFRERTFRAMYEAALADGGADIIKSAELILWESDVDPDWETTLLLVCWVEGSHEDARKVEWRVDEWVVRLRPSLSEGERKDLVRWTNFHANSLVGLRDHRAPA